MLFALPLASRVYATTMHVMISLVLPPQSFLSHSHKWEFQESGRKWKLGSKEKREIRGALENYGPKLFLELHVIESFCFASSTISHKKHAKYMPNCLGMWKSQKVEWLVKSENEKPLPTLCLQTSTIPHGTLHKYCVIVCCCDQKQISTSIPRSEPPHATYQRHCASSMRFSRVSLFSSLFS